MYHVDTLKSVDWKYLHHENQQTKSGLFLSSGKQVINIYQYLSLFLFPHLHTYNSFKSQQPTKSFKQIKHNLYLPWLRSSNSFALHLQLSKILTKAQETLIYSLYLSDSNSYYFLPHFLPFRHVHFISVSLEHQTVSIWGLYTCRSPFLEQASLTSSRS